MKRLIRWLLIGGALGLSGWAGYAPAVRSWKERTRINYREAAVTRGKIVAVVNSTGTVKPTRSVLVGSFVSGPIDTILVDFNDEVRKGDLLARIDPRLYAAYVARDRATLATTRAQVQRAQAELQKAKNDEARAQALRKENKNFISDTEMDQFKFNRLSLEAQVAVAVTSVDQAQANLDQSEANLAYTEIRSPVDGIIIDRKIDPGQTVAASFQTPELFTVAPDMRKEVRVFASVDEADIGLIREAQRTGRRVQFTVDAYPDELFQGTIFQIRQSSTTTQNVVTYPVVVSAPNAALKLLPGMTASISFQIGEVSNVLRIPNAALRFYPLREQVRPEDRHLMEASAVTNGESDEKVEVVRSAEEKAEGRRRRNRRHVWIVDGDFLRAEEVATGLTDSNHTEQVAGELREGDQLVTGIQPKK